MKLEKYNNLEQFVRQNREAFDAASPPVAVWNKIEQALDAPADAKGLESFIHQNRAQFDAAAPNAGLWAAIEQRLPTQDIPDALERFVTTHRADFDSAMPAFRVWTAIDKTLHPQAGHQRPMLVTLRRVVRMAAAVLLLLGAGAMGGIYFAKTQSASTQTVASLSDISPEYAEMVRYYNREIDRKVQQVSMQNNDPSILRDLEAIDQTMQELEAELQRAPRGAEEQIIANLIRSYQIKVEILERVLNRIQQSQATTKSEDDEVSI
ncbi:MAG TPA: hypothetical protein PKC76_05080 [Saprospiraceae bacterium]|nr:hypothetical protein [Saprospiraceae bacterium]HMP23481.1 hypothetical protein [Saprospiraceae bacterium]